MIYFEYSGYFCTPSLPAGYTKPKPNTSSYDFAFYFLFRFFHHPLACY